MSFICYKFSQHLSFVQCRSNHLFFPVRWRLCAAGLVTVASIHLHQTNHRGDGAHQSNQPVGESTRPQESRWHPVNGITKVNHAAEDGEKLPSHLSAELRATAGEIKHIYHAVRKKMSTGQYVCWKSSADTPQASL